MKPGDCGTISWCLTPEELPPDGWQFVDRIRVLAVGDGLAFYDSEREGRWLLERKRTFGYSRFADWWVEDHIEWTDHIPLTEKELELHRPDLPMTAAALTSVPMFDEGAISYPNFKELLADDSRSKETLNSHSGLPCPEFSMTGFGPRGGAKPSESYISLDESSFSATEVLWRALQYLEKHSIVTSNGIGIHRMGMKSGIPWYFVGDAVNPSYHERQGSD